MRKYKYMIYKYKDTKIIDREMIQVAELSSTFFTYQNKGIKMKSFKLRRCRLIRK